MARTLKQLDAFANALKARMDAHDKLHAANPLHSHGTPPVEPPPVDPPPVEPPPEPTLAYTTTIPSGATLTGKVQWLATVTSGTPTRFEFRVDGAIHWTELEAPWGGELDTTTLANGGHTLTVVGYDAAGAHVSPGVSVTVANVTTPPVDPPPVDPPPVDPPPTATGVYGVGVGGDTRNNHRLTQDCAYRFRSAGGTPRSIKVSERTGSGYSAGSGGRIRATVETDNGGKPSGNVLASVEWNPGNPGTDERWPEHLFAAGAGPLAKGTVYHVRFHNIDPSPASNYISLNTLYTYSGEAERPYFGSDYATLYPSPQVASKDLPIFDLEYADGTHDGMNYIGCMVGMSYVGIIAGSKQVRQTIKVSGGSRTVASVAVRVRRSSGSSPLNIAVVRSDGTVLGSVSVPASQIAQSAAGGDNGGAVWAKATFPTPFSLPTGWEGALLLSCASGTEYTAAPLQEGTSKGMRSRCFTDGVAQRGSGSSWSGLYGNEADLQFYFGVV